MATWNAVRFGIGQPPSLRLIIPVQSRKRRPDPWLLQRTSNGFFALAPVAKLSFEDMRSLPELGNEDNEDTPWNSYMNSTITLSACDRP